MFDFQVKLTSSEVDSICSPCRDRLKSFYGYFKFVLENQIKFKDLSAKLSPHENLDATVFVANESIPTPTLKDEPELTLSDFYDEHAVSQDSSESQNELKQEEEADYNNGEEIIVKLEPDNAATNKENVEKIRKKRSKSMKSRVIKKKRVKLTQEERDELSREKDELIKRFIVLKCEKCPKIDSFPDFAALMSHSRRKHRTEAVVKCCGREIKTKFLLAAHLQLHINVPSK